MDEQETKEPEYIYIKKVYEIKINDNKLRLNNDEIMFILVIGISYYKYVKKYHFYEIIKELELDSKNIIEVYNYLTSIEYEIIDED